MLRYFCLKSAYATGEIGSMFIADTSGLHRDGRAISNYRQVLQVEFAISTFGLNNQYLRKRLNVLCNKNILKFHIDFCVAFK